MNWTMLYSNESRNNFRVLKWLKDRNPSDEIKVVRLEKHGLSGDNPGIPIPTLCEVRIGSCEGITGFISDTHDLLHPETLEGFRTATAFFTEEI